MQSLRSTVHLRRSLRSTGSRKFIEDSPVCSQLRVVLSGGITVRSQIDWFWGIGSDGRGRNELGRALMRLRERLQARRRH
jgi:predicted NAD-dependent protein-ADP-ribosyltransferase YbiA (DUF1768 family)